MSEEVVSDYQKRQGLPILVTEAGAAGMIAVVRSLGRAGYVVHACSSDPTAVGLRSKFASYSSVHPPYQGSEFLPWAKNYVESHGIKAIVPSEGFYLGVRADYQSFADIMCETCGEDIVFKCLSKADVFGEFALPGAPPSIATRIPRSHIIDSVFDHDDVKILSDFLYPAYVKTDACHSKSVGDGRVSRVESAEEAALRIREFLGMYNKILVQESAIGRKATVNFCIVNGELLAESMCLATHESPHTGGLTSLRHTWWHQEMRDDALARVRYLRWSGVVMMEYKWDEATQQYCFIEMNSRYWAALHLDLFANRDFPKIELDAFLGLKATYALGPQKSVTCRNTVPPDFGYAVSRARDTNVPMLKRVWAIVEFSFIGFAPWIRNDFLFPGDRALYLYQWLRFITKLFQRESKA